MLHLWDLQKAVKVLMIIWPISEQVCQRHQLNWPSIQWFDGPCKPYIFWKHITLTRSIVLSLPRISKYWPVPATLYWPSTTKAPPSPLPPPPLERTKPKYLDTGQLSWRGFPSTYAENIKIQNSCWPHNRSLHLSRSNSYQIWYKAPLIV